MTISQELLDSCDTLFLDRDGVVNVWRPGDYVKTWDEFEFNPGFLDFIGLYSKHFRHIFIVTNQRGVGKGVMSQDSLDDIHARMLDCIRQAGGRIDGIYLCTATDDNDHMRKPNTGMADLCMEQHPDVSMDRTLMIGDQPSDLKFAQNCGSRFLLWQ